MHTAVIVCFLQLLSRCASFADISSVNFGVIRPERRVESRTISSSKNDQGIDPDYPYQFTGRLWFKPTIVKVPDSSPNPSISFFSLFGHSIGGTVALEYDESPVGPYKEYVTMSALVSKRLGLGLGQWGSRLYVSNQKAEKICKDIWGVPAEFASIDFQEENDGNMLKVRKYPQPDAPTNESQMITVEGWRNTRVLSQTEYETPAKRWGNLPVLWTPTIKALWAPLVLASPMDANDASEKLPLHKLRLSASAIRLRWSGFDNEADPMEGIPLGLGLVVDNVLIEISPQYANL